MTTGLSRLLPWAPLPALPLILAADQAGLYLGYALMTFAAIPAKLIDADVGCISSYPSARDRFAAT